MCFGSFEYDDFKPSVTDTFDLGSTLLKWENIFVNSDVSAGTFTGDGSALTGIGTGTGGVINTGSTTIGADSDADGVGILVLQTRGITRLTVANNGDIVIAGTVTGGVWNGTAIDISDFTNLVAGTNITLSGDTLNVDDAFIVNNASDTMLGTLTLNGLTITTGNALTLGVIRWDDGSDKIEGNNLADDSVDDDALDFTSITLNDFTVDIASTQLTDTGDIMYLADFDTFSELQTQIADKTLLNEEDAAIIDSAWTFSSGISGAVTGNASTATALQTARSISMSGDINATGVAFDGTAAINLTTTYEPLSIVNADVSNAAVISADKLADGATNAIVTLTQESNWDTHLTSDGSDHTFLDQNVTIATSPVFFNTNMTGNVSVWTNDSGYITSTASDENIEDVTGAMVSGNNESNISVTYDDLNGKLDFIIDNPANLDVTGDLTGNADTATALQTGRTIGMTGDVVWTSPSFDGTANVTATGTIQPDSVVLPTDTTGDYVASITGGAGIDSTGATSGENISHTLSFDSTEVSGSQTWGDASTDTIVWTWDRVTGTDPTMTFGSNSVTFNGMVTAGNIVVDSIGLNDSKIQFIGGGTVENAAAGTLTLMNTADNEDIVFSYKDGGVTQTITIDASAAGTLISSTGSFIFADTLLPSGTVSIGIEAGGFFFDNIVGDHIVGVSDVTTDVLVATTNAVIGTSLTLASGSITDTTGQISFGNEKILLGNFASTLTGTTHERFKIDGSTNKIAFDGTTQVGYSFSNIYDGTLSGVIGFPIAYNFANTMEASRTGSRTSVMSRCLNLTNLWSGSVTRSSGAGTSNLENLGIELTSSVTGTIAITVAAPRTVNFDGIGGRFLSNFVGTLDETDGVLVANIIGGVSKAFSQSAPTLVGTPEINYIGGDSIATMPSAFSSVGTSIGHRFTASGGNDNIGARIKEITTANNENVGLDVNDISGATTNFAIRTGTGLVLFGDAVIIGGTTPDSLFEVDGPMGLAIQTVTGNTTLDNTHSTLLVNASGNVTITLPTAASAFNSTDGIGRIYRVKKIDVDGDLVTLDGNGSETIDGGLTAVITVRNETLTIQTDGSNWHIL